MRDLNCVYCCYTNDNFLELPLSRYNTDAFQIIIKFTVRIIHNYVYLSLNITEIYLASQISFESSTLPLFSRISWQVERIHIYYILDFSSIFPSFIGRNWIRLIENFSNFDQKQPTLATRGGEEGR